MDTRKMAMEYRMASWAEALQERVTKKENIRAFCGRKGISKNTYYYWQRKLREKVIKELVPAGQVKKAEMTETPKGWAVCEIEKVETQDRTVTIEIGKCRVKADAGTDEGVLEKVCRVLVSLC